MEMSTEVCRWRKKKKREREGKVPLRLDVEEGVDAKKKKKTKEVQKERTGLSLCFGWRGIQGGKRKKRSVGLREGEGELILLNSHAN